MAWKIEYGYLILVFVLFLCVKFLKDRKTAIVGMVSLVGVYFILSLPGKLCQPMSNYLMTSIFTPLSSVLSKNIDDMNSKGILTEELNEIDSLTPIYDIINTTSGINLPNMYWNLEDNISNQDQIEWIKAGAKICIHYWKDYLDNRIYVYKYTNGMVPNVINHTGSEDSGIVLNMQYYGKNYFYEHFKYTKPILGSEIRKRIISLLACREFYDYKETNILYGVMYNSFIPLLLLAAILLLGLINKNFCDCIVILIMVWGVAINFILAPAHFWMYYMPFYLAAYVFIFFKLILRFDRTK